MIALIFAISTAITIALYNCAVWLDNGKLWHRFQFLFIATLTGGYFFYWSIPDFALFVAVHWFLFDGFYNVLRGESWLYNNKQGDSFTDKFGY